MLSPPALLKVRPKEPEAVGVKVSEYVVQGHPVRTLARTQIGPMRMGQLRTGEIRDLTRDELGALLDAVKL